MSPPTHGPHCRTIFCYPRACPDCRQEVYYWSCTCGSHVLFDELGEPWPKHECARRKRLLSLRPSTSGKRTRPLDESNPMLLVRCELCGDKIRRGRMEEHVQMVHGRRKMKRGSPKLRGTLSVSGRKQNPETAAEVANLALGKLMVTCPTCGAGVQNRNLRKHRENKCPNSSQSRKR